MSSTHSAPPNSPPRNIFIGYSHKDKVWLDRVLVFLRPFQRAGRVDTWSDRQIVPGEEWRTGIEIALEEADVVLLLVSADFLASDFIQDVELPRILARAGRDLRILCLIIGPSGYHHSPLRSFQAVNDPNAPLSGLSVHRREQELVRLSEIILNPSLS
jgi:TIR domain